MGHSDYTGGGKEKKRAKSWHPSFIVQYFTLVLAVVLCALTICAWCSLAANHNRFREETRQTFERVSQAIEADQGAASGALRRPLQPLGENLAQAGSLEDALQILQNQHDAYTTQITIILSVVTASFALFSLAIPIFNYAFLQKNQVDKINSQVDETREQFEKSLEQYEETKQELENAKQQLEKTNQDLVTNRRSLDEYIRKFEDMEGRFKAELTRLDKSVDQSQNVTAIKAAQAPSSDKKEDKDAIAVRAGSEKITPISDRPEDQARAKYLEAMMAQDKEQQVKLLREAIALEPNNALYPAFLGATLHNMKRYDEALGEMQKAIALESDNAQYHNNLGATLHEMKRYDEALEEKQKAVALEPDNAQYHNNLGITLHGMKRYDEALEEKQKAVALEPDNAWYHDSFGITLDEMKRYDEALEEKQKAVALEPDNARYHNNLGATLHEMKRYDEALEEAQKAVALEPDNAQYHNNLGITLHEMKRYNEALEEKQKAVAPEPDNARYHDSLGATLHAMKRYDEALEEKQKAVELEPENADYIYSLGATLYRLHRYPEALTHLSQALESESQLTYASRAYAHRGLAKLRLALKGEGQPEAGLADLNKAVSLDSSEHRNNINRAEGLLLLNKPEKAEKDLKTALEKDDKDPNAWHLYSELYKARGEEAEAQRCQEKAIELGYIPEPE